MFLSACFIVVSSLNCHLHSSLIICVLSLMFGLRVHSRKPPWELIHVFSICVVVTVSVASSLFRRSRECSPGNSRKLTHPFTSAKNWCLLVSVFLGALVCTVRHINVSSSSCPYCLLCLGANTIKIVILLHGIGAPVESHVHCVLRG